jgi:hypothetical protein
MFLMMAGNGNNLDSRGRAAQTQVDGICLQETIKKSFTDRELEGLCRGFVFKWSWLGFQLLAILVVCFLVLRRIALS